MALLDAFDVDVNEPDTIEVVTMHADLSDGLTVNDARAFKDMQSALAYVRNLSADERERSWIRHGDHVHTLEAAESELACNAPLVPLMDGH